MRTASATCTLTGDVCGYRSVGDCQIRQPQKPKCVAVPVYCGACLHDGRLGLFTRVVYYKISLGYWRFHNACCDLLPDENNPSQFIVSALGRRIVEYRVSILASAGTPTWVRPAASWWTPKQTILRLATLSKRSLSTRALLGLSWTSYRCRPPPITYLWQSQGCMPTNAPTAVSTAGRYHGVRRIAGCAKLPVLASGVNAWASCRAQGAPARRGRLISGGLRIELPVVAQGVSEHLEILCCAGGAA